MVILVRSLKTGLYAANATEWTADRKLARGFTSNYSALLFIKQAQFMDTELVFTFGRFSYDLAIPAEPRLWGPPFDSRPLL